MELPRHLLAAIEGLCAGHSFQTLGAAYESLSARYRRENSDQDFSIKTEEEALAYVASRLPATYGAVHKALSELARLDPTFTPAKILDMGAGPGTATLVAQALWPSVAEAKLIEPNAMLAQCGQALMEALAVPATYERGTLDKMGQARKADLVLASYVLNEVPPDMAIKGVDALWDCTADALAIVETGTPHGYKTLVKARDRLVAKGAHIAAPCTHHLSCPIAEQPDNWCHFAVRVQRSSLHRKIKPSASLAYEDEKFCYLIATRRPMKTRPAARLVGAPKGPKVITLPLCRESGAYEVLKTSKRDPDYSTLKRLDWGDALDK